VAVPRLPRLPRPQRGDLLAGLTVALVLVPQSLAYAALAGLPPEHGLYAAAVAPLLSGLVGSSPYLQTGPTAITSLLVLGAISPLPALTPPEYAAHAALLALVVGVTRAALGLARGGVIAYLMSQPVLAGFTWGAAALIMASQVPAALGRQASSDAPLSAAAAAIGDPGGWSAAAIGIAVGTLVVTLLGRRLHPLFPGALVAAVAAMVLVEVSGWDTVRVGDIPAGLPPLTFDLPWSALPELLLPGLVIALVGFAEPASIARKYASAERSSWDPDRELVGQGLANVGLAVTGGYPVGGSFSRTALNHLSGAHTRWSSVATGAVVLASLPFVSLLSDLPQAALAGLVIASVLALLDPRPVLRLGRWSRPQLVVALATTTVGLLAAPQVQWGVVTGVTLALFLHLWRELRLDMDVWDEHDLLHVRPEGVLYFGSAPGLETRILGELAAHPRLGRVEIHLQRLGRIDVTGAIVLRGICRDLAAAEVPVVISGVPPHSRRLIRKVLADEDIDHTHGPRNTVSPAHPRLRERPTGPSPDEPI
jgi:SulP family sulfate permease